MTKQNKEKNPPKGSVKFSLTLSKEQKSKVTSFFANTSIYNKNLIFSITVIIIILVKLVQKISQKFGKSFYSLSFNEGNVSNTLEIFASQKIDEIEKSEYLVNSLDDKVEKNIVYRMHFDSRKSLEYFKELLEKEKQIKKISVILS